MKAGSFNEQLKNERLGQSKLNTQGIKMTIVEYTDSTHMVVEFEDGYRREAAYTAFKQGYLKHPNYPKPKPMPLKAQRMAEVVTNKEGYKMRICEYNKAKDVTVEFLDEYHAKVHTDYRFFHEGGVKNPNRIGRFGERLGNESPTQKDGKELKVYKTWRLILHRVNQTYDRAKRFYEDVSIAEEWLYYTNYYNWVTSQENYEKWENNEGGGVWGIDKDILSDPFNKIYSPDTCCLVPDYINSVVVRQRQKDDNRELPIGVRFYPYDGGRYFYCDCRKDKNINVYFDTIDEAAQAYKEMRYKYLRESAEYAYARGDITKRCYEGLLKFDIFAYEK